MDDNKLNIPHTEVGNMWLMMESLGWQAVHMAVSHYDYSGIKDACDINEVKGWMQSYHLCQIMRVILDYAAQ